MSIIHLKAKGGCGKVKKTFRDKGEINLTDFPEKAGRGKMVKTRAKRK